MTDAKVDVFMPFYVADYLADTTDLTIEEHGVYLLLLLNLWRRNGELPCEPTRLAKMVGISVPDWERVWAAIGRFFEFKGGHIRQGRLSREIAKAKGLRTAASENGRKGAEVRWGGHDSANGVAIVSPMANRMAKNSSSPSPSESPSESEPPSEPPSPGDTRAVARPRTRSIAAPSQVPQSEYVTVLAGFCAIWQERYGEPYAPTPADKSQLGRLMQSLPRELLSGLPGCFENYLRDEEPFVAQKMRHSLAHFCTQGGVNKYRVQAPVLTAKEATGLAGGRQWLALKGRQNA